MIFENRYGLLDRVLHRVAFRAGTAQHAMADVEELVFGDTLESVTARDPVFISALPRSGTTILLNLLAETGRFATHTYRDMPFVLCPMLWSRLSEPFAVRDVRRERAHGDGLEVSADSPEAFEEMVWKHFWPDHYRSDRILPWEGDGSDPGFERFLERHMRKIVALRRDDEASDLRYLSKNNLNIARLGALPGPLRRGTFLVSFREPLQHAASMLRQHRRFSRIHEQDDFVRRYMEAIGHHEFGRTLRPVDFGGWLTDAPEPDRLEFWIRYWIAAYRRVLERAGERIHLVSYRRLTERPEEALHRLASTLRLPADVLAPRAERLHPPRTHEVDEAEVARPVLDEAAALHGRLEREASV